MSVTATGSSISQKHPLEDTKSWELHIERRSAGEEPFDRSGSWRRRLEYASIAAESSSKPKDDDDESENDDDDEDDDGSFDLPFTVKHKKQKKHIPLPGGDTTHGMMIDAGSVSTSLLFDLRSCDMMSCSKP